MNIKKLLNSIITAGLIGAVGCATITALTPAQIAQIGTAITEGADQGAVYAIQKDAANANYFKLADAVLDNFVLGTDLSPTALQTSLAKVTSTNQWVNLTVAAVVFAYDTEYQQYVSGQVSNNAAAVAWITAVETGFKEALASTGTGLKAGKLAVPYFVKADGTLDKAAIKARLKAARK